MTAPAPASPGPITVYGADWCGDCRRAKAWFADNDVPYTFVDLIEAPEHTETVREFNGGATNIPVVVFADNTHLTEPSNTALAEKVARLSEGAGAPASGSSAELAPEPAPLVIDNEAALRFELRSHGGEAAELLSLADYSLRGETLVIPHVETAVEHRGNGFAERLMDGVVENLRSTGRRVVPLCPYAAAYLRDRPETHDLLA
jgi:predicted GNAT family acetyltransferase/glutaredoxin